MAARQGDGGNSTVSSHPNASRPELNIKERAWDVKNSTPGGSAATSAAVAGLVIIHGGNWHSGWFGELGDLLSSPLYGVRVSAPDLPSHGLSDDVVSPYRAYVPDFVEYTKEVIAAVDRARAAVPEGAPVFLLGESMGGLSVLQALVLNDEATLKVDGLLLCGALVRVAPEILPPRAVFQV